MNKCEKCDTVIWSGKGEYTLCVKCQIGDRSPAIWLLERVCKKLQKNYGDIPHLKHFKKKEAGGSLYYNGKTGVCLGNPDRAPSDSVSIRVGGYCDNKKGNPNVFVSFMSWTEGGLTAYKKEEKFKITKLENFVVEALPLYMETVYDLLKFAQRDTYVCSTCQVEKPNPQSGSHFAGSYCAKCWEVYKKKNSRVCHRCRSPLWRCCC